MPNGRFTFFIFQLFFFAISFVFSSIAFAISSLQKSLTLTNPIIPFFVGFDFGASFVV